jgi:Tfp pilus assembly protein PilO
MPLLSQQPAAKNTTGQTLSFLAVVLVGSGFYVSTQLVLPRLEQARTEQVTVQADLNQTAEAATSLQNARQRVVTASKDLAKAGINLSIVDSMLPPTEDIPGLYQLMDGVMAQTPGLIKPSFQIAQPTKETNGQVKIRISTIAICKYEDCKRLLVELQGMIRPVTLERFSLTARQDPGSVDQYTFTAEGYVRARALSSAYDSGAK